MEDLKLNPTKNSSAKETTENSKAAQIENASEKSKAHEAARQALINNLGKGSGSSAQQIVEVEGKVLMLESSLNVTMARIAEIEESLKNSGRTNADGKALHLSSFKKKNLRTEKRNLKKAKNDFKAQISELSKLYTTLNQIDTKKDRRASTRNSAKKDSYHKQHSGAVEKALVREISAMGEADLAAFIVNLSKLDSKEGDALIMKTLMKAPRFLHTRVVANADARVGYLQFFRSELGATKKTTKKRSKK